MEFSQLLNCVKMHDSATARSHGWFIWRRLFWGEISLVTSFPAPLFDSNETNHPPRVRLIKRAKAMLKERLYSSCIMRKYYLGNGVTWKNSQIFFLLTFFLWSDFFQILVKGNTTQAGKMWCGDWILWTAACAPSTGNDSFHAQTQCLKQTKV